jgi:hypothetical protein
MNKPMLEGCDEMFEVLQDCRRYLTEFGSVEPSQLVRRIEAAMEAARRPDPEAVMLTEAETNELVERINANPNLHPLPSTEAVMLREARDALQAMMDSWFDYHDAHSLTQPVTGASGNAFEKALAARDTIDAALNPKGQP